MHTLRKHMFNFSFSCFINCLNEVTQRELRPSATATKKDACDNENKPDANSKINEKVVGKTPQNLSSSNIIPPQWLQQQNYWSHRVPPICQEQNKKNKLRSKFVPNVATTDTKKHVGVTRWSQQLHLHWLCLTTRPQLHPCPDLRSAAPLTPHQLFYTPKVNNS